jgi:uncharacterized membrane protein YjjB (DUF3815 family)
LLPCLITIVPGGNLYYAVRGLISNDSQSALKYGLEALKIGLGIAGGILIVSVSINLIRGIAEHMKKKE